MSHGSGGVISHRFVDEFILKILDNPILAELGDSALLEIGKTRLAFTTDSYVVKPIFFPGGDIGKLSICGTVNDLAVAGADPLYISLALILEEGFPEEDLKRILESAAKTAKSAGVTVITGDTKVVEKGGADGIFITTAGVGIFKSAPSDIKAIKEGDAVLISGSIGDHGIAVLRARENLSISTELESDVAPLNHLIRKMREAVTEIRFMRDPTRGGLASTLHEIVRTTNLSVEVFEKELPVKKEVRMACDILGFEPAALANEGKVVAVAPKDKAASLLDVMKSDPLGRDAAIIGEVKKEPHGKVILRTAIGSGRILDLPVGEILPRIC